MLAAAHGVGQADPGPHDVAQLEVEGRDRARQVAALDERHLVAVHPDLELAEPAARATRAGKGDGVAHEQDALRRLESPDERPEVRVDVERVGDELDPDAVIEESRQRQPRVAMREAAHGVEEVRRRHGAGGVAGPRLRDVGRRVAQRDAHATRRRGVR